MLRTRRASGLALTLRRTVLLILASVTAGTGYCAQRLVQVRQDWEIPTPFFYNPVLEDVSASGLLLLNELGGYVAAQSWNITNPRLVLRTPPSEREMEIPLPDWPKFQYELPAGIADISAGPFKFVGGGKGIVGAQGPWLVLIDVPGRKVVRRVLALTKPRDLEQPEAAIRVIERQPDGRLAQTGRTQKRPAGIPSPPILAVNPRRDQVAVAYNGPARHWVFIFTSDLTRRIAGWEVPKAVEDVCWSENGKSLAVLYRTPWNLHAASAGIPNVSIFDTTSWKELLAFATGDYDAKVAFSRDDRLLYAITSWYGGSAHAFGFQAKGDIRAFSTATGELKQTIKVKGTGVRCNLVVSPDGRLIAAESTTYPLRPPWEFDTAKLDVHGSFVILDAATGRVLCREGHRMLEYPLLPLFFSPDGRELIVNFASFKGGDVGGRIVGYSLAGLHR
jgi:hypothetical protein